MPSPVGVSRVVSTYLIAEAGILGAGRPWMVQPVAQSQMCLVSRGGAFCEPVASQVCAGHGGVEQQPQHCPRRQSRNMRRSRLCATSWVMHPVGPAVGRARLRPLLANHAGSRAGRVCNRRYELNRGPAAAAAQPARNWFCVLGGVAHASPQVRAQPTGLCRGSAGRAAAAGFGGRDSANATARLIQVFSPAALAVPPDAT